MYARTIRWLKIFVLLVVALYATFVALGNLMDYDSNYEFVKHVLSMDTTFRDNHLMWRAITNPALHTLAYWGIIMVEIAIAVVGWVGVYLMLKTRNAPSALFTRAKTVGLYAFMFVILLWFVGFIDFGSEWFAMWQSHTWNGKQTAMDITAVMLGFLIVYLLPEPELEETARKIG